MIGRSAGGPGEDTGKWEKLTTAPNKLYSHVQKAEDISLVASALQVDSQASARG